MCLDWEEKCDGKEPCIYHPAQGLCAAQTQGGIICTSLDTNGAFWKSIEHIANGVLELNNVVALITITHTHMYTHTCTRTHTHTHTHTPCLAFSWSCSGPYGPQALCSSCMKWSTGTTSALISTTTYPFQPPSKAHTQCAPWLPLPSPHCSQDRPGS